MKNKKYIKLMFSLLILLLILFINNISYALIVTSSTPYETQINALTEYSNTTKLNINHNALLHNKYIFCRDRGTQFPISGNFPYYKVGENVYTNNRWSYLFRDLEDYEPDSVKSNAEKKYQQIIWSGFSTDNKKDNKTYGSKIAMSETDLSNFTEGPIAMKYEDAMKNFDLNDLETRICLGNQWMDGNNKFVIAVQIQAKDINGQWRPYPYVNYNNTKDYIGGIKSFAIRNSSNQLIKFDLFYINGDKRNFIWEGKSSDNVLSVWNKSTDMQNAILASNELSEINSKDYFYVMVDLQYVSDGEINITAFHNILKTDVTFTYIKTDKGLAKGSFVRCAEHSNTVGLERQEGLYTLVSVRNNQDYDSKKSNGKITIDGKDGYVQYNNERVIVVERKCIWCDMPVLPRDTVCRRCGEEGTIQTIKKYRYDVYNYKIFCTSCKPRSEFTNYQKLVLVKSNSQIHNPFITKKISVGNFNFTVEKYEKDTVLLLSGAKFDINVTQGDKSLYSIENCVISKKTFNVQIQDTTTPIYVKIKETEAPTGYEILNNNIITIKYKFDNSSKKWVRSPEDTNTYENVTINNSTIKVYNQKEVTPIQFMLKKYGSYTNGISESLLEGAEFNVTFNQNEKIKTEIIDNNDTLITYKPENTEHPVIVTIKEIKAPKDYFIMKQDIKITFYYSTTSNKWHTTFTYKDGNNDIWTWDKECECDDSKCKDGCNARSFPNEYISNEGDRIRVEGGNYLTIKVFNEKYPPIRIKLEKYGPYSEYTMPENSEPTNSIPNIMVEGAEFEIKAIQDDVVIYSGLVTDNDTIVEINPSSKSNVYVIIKETKAPPGYASISKDINIIYALSNSQTHWNYKYRPEKDEWNYNYSETGWSSSDTFGEWKFTEKDIAANYVLPNVFGVIEKIENEGITYKDIIRVEKLYNDPTKEQYDSSTSGQQGHIIKVYNRTAIDINLEKYNSYTSNNEQLLDGAEFTITATQGENREPLDVQLLTDTEGSTTINYRIYPKETYENAKIYVTITETKAPNGYVALKEPIKAEFTFENGYWQPTFKNANWNVEADENTGRLPNTYKSINNDYIYVYNEDSNAGISNYYIKVYNNPIIFNLNKVAEDNLNTLLPKAIFKLNVKNIQSFKFNDITLDGNSISIESYELSNGSVQFSEIKLADKSQPLIVELTEIEAPDFKDNYYYKKLEGEIILTFNRNDRGEFSLASDNGVQYLFPEVEQEGGQKVRPDGTPNDVQINSSNVNVDGYNITINVPNRKIPHLELDLQKYNSYHAEKHHTLANAKFNITVIQENGVNEESKEITIGEDGKLNYTIIPQNTNDIYVTITETVAPDGRVKLKNPIKARFTYDTSSNVWKPSFIVDGTSWERVTEESNDNTRLPNTYRNGQDYIYVDFDEEPNNTTTSYQINVYNDLLIKNLTLLKVDADTQEKLSVAKFSGTITNVKQGDNLTDANEDGVYEFTNLKTNADGKIEIQNIELKDITKNVVVTIREISAPTIADGYYKILDGEIIVTLEYDSEGDSFVLEQVAYNQNDITIDTSNVSITNQNEIKVTIPNKKINNISLELFKMDAENKQILPGAQFSGTITNVKSGNNLTDRNQDGIYEFNNLQTDKEGKITLENIVLHENVIYDDQFVIINISEIKVPKSNTTDYYYKKLEGDIIIKLKHNSIGGMTLVDFVYNGPEQVEVNDFSKNTQNTDLNTYSITLNIPNQRLIDISGRVWLDGQTGIKPVKGPNGIMDEGEQGVAGVIVKLVANEQEIKQYNNDTESYMTDTQGNYIVTAKTNSNGYYKFVGLQAGANYQLQFEYDGINYEDTIETSTDSKAHDVDRAGFNNKFKTITKNNASDGNNNIKLEYKYDNYKSNLITLVAKNANNELFEYDKDGKEQVVNKELTTINANSKLELTDAEGTAFTKYLMLAKTEAKSYATTTGNVNFGLVRRGTDIALSTNVDSGRVTINGQETTYDYNVYDANNNKINLKENIVTYGDEEVVEIGTITTDSKNILNRDTGRLIDTYKLNLYSSDLNYQSSNKEEELKVFVTYSLVLQNQSDDTVYINEVLYKYDDNYTLSNIYYANNDNTVKYTSSGNSIVINDTIALNRRTSKTIYIEFEVNDISKLNEQSADAFVNSAEITSYSTEQGLIDQDSQPGNLYNDEGIATYFEDDSDRAKGIYVTVPTTPPSGGDPDDPEGDSEPKTRVLSGYVFEDIKDTTNNYDGKYSDNESKVSGVKVQLIELKGNSEVISQEKISDENGAYEFRDFIPGNYIVRFVYGDGTTYDNVHNGQDYKSTVDKNYQEEWYNAVKNKYADDASVARDNEARRLQTMAYSVNIDAQKGLLLKLLDNVTTNELNKTEKETLKTIYNKLNDEQENNLNTTDITEINDDVVRELKQYTLANTSMMAETSTIKIAVDSETGTETGVTTNVNGLLDEYNNFSDICFGISKRPETKVELKKHITSLIVYANNGQKLTDAHIEVKKAQELSEAQKVNDYLTNLKNVKGVKNNITLLDTVWQYEVSPKELNTIIDGASLNYDYTLVLYNTSEDDYLSETLLNDYSTLEIDEYEAKLIEYSRNANKDTIGTYLGTAYYEGGTTGEKVLTNVTNIRDYLNNNLEFVKGIDSNGNTIEAAKNEENEKLQITHRILKDDCSTKDIPVNTVLETESSGNMDTDKNAVLYTVTLGKDKVSSVGTMDFENYIAEVMSYTNAAGRRSTEFTPGNAEIIDHEKRDGKSHEIDEAATTKIQIGVTTGEDRQTIYIIITTVMAGLVVLALGLFVAKKHIKK